MHSFNHLESNFWWSLQSIKVYQPFLLGHLARSMFSKSTWKIDPNFHIYQASHFVTLHVTQNAIYSWNMMYIAFWYPNHLSMIKIGWSKWGKVTLLEPKRSLWFLLKIEVIRCNFKCLLGIFSLIFIWSIRIFMWRIIWRALIPLCDIRMLSWNIWSP